MSLLRRKVTGLSGIFQRKDSSSQNDDVDESASVVPLIKRFCASADSEDDTGALAQITEVVFSNPRQAQEAARMIRKTLSDRSKPGHIYNATMLIQILTRHQESAGFTQFIDDRLVGTLRQILRDLTNIGATSTRLLIQEMVQEMESTVNGQFSYRNASSRAEAEHRAARWSTDPGIQRILDLRKDPKNWEWIRTQRQQQQRFQQQPPMPQAPSGPLQSQQAAMLPAPYEMSQRLTEAEQSAQVLSQAVLAAPNEVFTNELIREFQTRCVIARNSLETYLRQTSDPATYNNIDAIRVKVVAALQAYEAAERRQMARPEPQATRDLRTQSQQIAAPVVTRAQPRQIPSNGDVSPIDPTAWQNPFDDSNETGFTPASSNQAAHAQNSGGNRPALSLSTSYEQRSRPSAPSASIAVSDLVTEPERPSRYRF